MNTTHTPGPWSVFSTYAQPEVRRADGGIVAVLPVGELQDARLIAAAPELLEALHGIGQALGIPEGERSPCSITCGVLERVNRLAEIEAQEPACWAVIDPTGGSSVEYTAAWMEACHEHIGDLISGADMPEAASFVVRPLYARPAPALPLPTGERQAVLLTDEQIDRMIGMHWGDTGAAVQSVADFAARVEAAALAANGLEVRRG